MKTSRIGALALLLPSSLLHFACGDGEPDSPQPYECSDATYEESAGGAGGVVPAQCDEPASPSEEIEIAGDYTDNFGGKHKITASQWGTINLSYVDNDENYAVGRNDESAEWDACYYSLIFWHENEGMLYYCQSAFAAESECTALNSVAPDPANLTTGCSGYPWSELIPD